jgi:hypothetical protein
MPFSRKFVSLIEDHADSLSRKWVDFVQQHPNTPTYHTYDREKLYDRAFNVYSHLGTWVSDEITKAEISEQYTALGAQRREEGFQLSEVIQALITTRRILWFEVLDEGFLDSALDLHLALELNNQVVQFFDSAIFFATVGYERG